MTEKQKKTVVTIPQQNSVESFINQAIISNVPIETLERLLAMRTQVKAEQSKEAFIKAMADFQSECPVIEKKKTVMGKDKTTVRYKYAPLDSIVTQVKSLISKNGLSYRFHEIKDEKNVEAICTVTHILGHSEESGFKVAIGSEEYMTDAQKYGARNTLAKRYAFCNAFGILTGDEDTDDDGNKDNKKKPPQKPSNIKSDIMFLLKTLGLKQGDDAKVKIKTLTGIDATEIADDLQEIKNRLEILVAEMEK